MTASKNIVISGVGGQGTLLASRILGSCAQSCGYDVKVSEVHGMSQRGGSVITYVRYGGSVASPIIEAGEADLLLAFEQLECLRWAHMLKPGGIAVMNTQKILPMPVISGSAAYPDGIAEQIRSQGIELYEIDAQSAALSLDNIKAVNVILIGLAARFCEMPEQAFKDAIKATVKPDFLELNLQAFETGYNHGK